MFLQRIIKHNCKKTIYNVKNKNGNTHIKNNNNKINVITAVNNNYNNFTEVKSIKRMFYSTSTSTGDDWSRQNSISADFKRTKFRETIKRNGYEVIRPLGYGAFGHVTLCKGIAEEDADGYYAIKTQRLKGSELTPDQAAKEKSQQEAIRDHVSNLSDGIVKTHLLKALTEITDIIINASPKEGEFRLYNGRQVRRAVAETEILEYVKECPFVITKHSEFIDGQEIFLVTDLIEGGSLERYLNTRDRSAVTEEEAKFYAAELVVAMSCLSEKNVTHRDIKPSNIMLDREGHIKVMDFGLATTRREDLVLVCGTPEYIPPEVLLSKKWNAHTLDRYALGILIYRMIYGVTPYEGENAKSVFFNILTSKIEFPTLHSGGGGGSSREISEEAKSLILNLIDHKPENRLTLDEIKNHKWFENINWEDVNKRKLEPPYKPESLEDGYASRPIPLL